MPRRCSITSKGVMTGNNVSHAMNKTRRRFLPNLQRTATYSEALRCVVRLRLTTQGLRSIEHNGGIDAYLLSLRRSEMSPELLRLRRRIERARAARTPTA